MTCRLDVVKWPGAGSCELADRYRRPVTAPVAHVWAEQERQLEKAGRRMPVEDSYLAATARRYGLTIATGNEQDFRRPGLKVFNPFKELPRGER